MILKTIGILGSGIVGRTLATGFLDHGHRVMIGTRDPRKLADWRAGAGPDASVGTLADTGNFGEILVLAVKGSVAQAALDLVPLKALAGKTIIDATNPIEASPPEKGVLRYFTGPNESLMERLQDLHLDARFVKAFSCVGNAYMVDPKLPGGPPTMFICGNDQAAKNEVIAILDRFGWDVEDLGAAEAARAIEPLAMLWCIPGIREGRWSHAFKLLRA